jgi:diketogulonate reductase-like aldo/keto reductase
MAEHPPLPTVRFADGIRVPVLGLGTWHMGESATRASREVRALQYGIALGMTLIDTAEMYGDGGAERVVGRAVAGRRDEVFIVSKVYPHNAGLKSAIAACERSLDRLGTDRLDLYLLHWRGRIPLAETVDAFERLRRDGKIVRWGVSNFDVDDMTELLALPDGARCAANQVLYNLEERGVEWNLLPLCRQQRIAIMAYSPVGEGRLITSKKLATLAASFNATPAQLALAWLISHPNVIAIPQSSNLRHLDENRAAAGIPITPTLRAALDAAFPPPSRATALRMI